MFLLGPIWTGTNGFANFFIFVMIVDRKVGKSHVCNCIRAKSWTRHTSKFFFREGSFHIFKLLQVPFSPDCSFKITEKPSKFSKSVGVDIVVTRSQRQFQHVSAGSMTTPTGCQCSQRLYVHTQFSKNLIKFFVTFFLSFFSYLK